MRYMTAILLTMALGATDAPPLLRFICERATGPITIDGNGDEGAWTSAPAIGAFRLWHTLGEPTESTTVGLAYDDDTLYALFRCVDRDVFALYDERDANLWESDVVELFFQPNPKNPIYYEFEISPNNAVFDARMVNTGSGGFRRWAKWNCDIRTATHVRGTLNDWSDRDEGYTVEIAIPRDTFREVIGDKPFKGQTWKFAAVRVDLSVTLEGDERSSTANVPDGDIHKKDGYFTLAFN